MATPTRSTLLQRLKDMEDQKSWREFFDTYWRLIYDVAIKAGLNDAEAQDVVQETVIAVAKKMPEFDYVPGRDSFKGWLLQTTRWKIADQFRKRLPVDTTPRRPTVTRRTKTIERIPDPSCSALESVWETEWQKHLLKTALKRVKNKVAADQYEIFKLYVIANWPVQKVVEALGVSENQVYLVKSRMTALLKREIAKLEGKLI